MFRRRFVAVAVWSLPLLTGIDALAQRGDQTVYTYVAEWRLERGKTDEFLSYFEEKGAKPVLDRMLSDGTIVEWGLSANVVHTEEGTTHSVWWTAPSVAGTQKVLSELYKLPPNPGMTAVQKHHDHLLRSIVYRTRGSGAATGFFHINYTRVQPGKGPEWRELWEKYAKPTYEGLLADGTLLAYGVDAEWIHTDDPGGRFSWYTTPDAEGIDKVNAAFAALREQSGPEASRAIGAAFRETVVAEAHRDGLESLLHYVRK